MSVDPFVRDLWRLLMSFALVVIGDLTVGSAISGKLRLWFPQWIDPLWEQRPEAWVVYSQSYLAGVALAPASSAPA